MKRWKSILCAGMAMAVIASAAAFAGCKTEEKTSENNEDSEIYAIYTKYAEAAGDDAMTYEEWLESIKGEDGKDGATWLVSNGAPADTTGKDGDLCLDSSTFDLYQRKAGAWSKIGSIKGADGDDGEGAYEAWKALDPENNTASKDDWVASLQGEDGKDGKNGTKWFYDAGDPASSSKVADAQVGDFYLDTSSGNVYCKGADDWGTPVFKFGAAGSSSVAPQAGKVSIPKKMPVIATVENVTTSGWHYIYLDTGSANKSSATFSVANYNGESNFTGLSKYKSYFLASKEPEHEGKNVLFALLYLKQSEETTRSFKFQNDNGTGTVEDATITVKPVGAAQEFVDGQRFVAPIFFEGVSNAFTKQAESFTYFGESIKDKYFNHFNGWCLSITSITSITQAAKFLLCTTGDVNFKVEINNVNGGQDILSESDASENANLINKSIYLRAKDYHSSWSLYQNAIVPAYVELGSTSFQH